MKSAFGLALVLFLFGFFPLLGGPRYEAALLAGVLGPGWVAIVVTDRTIKRLNQGRGADGHALERGSWWRLDHIFARAVLDLLPHVLLVLLVAGLHGVIYGFCEPGLGFSLLALGPIMGMSLAAFVGALLGAVVSLLAPHKPSRALSLLGILPPLMSALWAVARFYSTPTVYAYDQFAGYFAGPIYDTVEYELHRLLTFRTSTVLTMIGMFCCGRQFAVTARSRGAGFRIALASGLDARLVGAFGVVSLLASLVIVGFGSELNHRGTARSIQQALGRSMSSGLCRVIYSGGVQAMAARRVARECEGHLRQHQAYFGLDHIDNVDVYLFANSEEKRQLIGAGRTNIAKPWRREVYITDDGFPHPILGHELAHAVSGQFGHGPFKVAGQLFGLIVDPGRVEGFAEAAALREDSFGSLQEWAAAMRGVGRLPPLQQLFQLGFLGESAARSYTAAGAFVQYLRERFGPHMLTRWYGGEGLEKLTESSLAELERAWHGQLDATDVPERVLAAAAPRFSRPGHFERKCPHAMDRTNGQLSRACPQDEGRVRELIKQLKRWDPNNEGIAFEAPRCLTLLGEQQRAKEEILTVLGSGRAFEPHELKRAADLLGDTYYRLGQLEEAKKQYNKAIDLSFNPDEQRQLSVKLWALDQGSPLQEPLKQLFLYPQSIEWANSSLLFEWRESGIERAFATYLLARLALSGQRFVEARALMNELDESELPLDSLLIELRRMRVVAACEQRLLGGSDEELTSAWAKYQELDLSVAERMHLSRLVERCTVE